MHQCLLIPELLLKIFECVTKFKYNHIGMRIRFRGSHDLAALARTCRSFQEPALDVLWRIQWSLAPLAMCMPPDLLQIYTDHTGRKFMQLRRTPVSADWERALSYASRIRKLEFISSLKVYHGPRIPPNVLHELLATCPRPSLLPNLISLCSLPYTSTLDGAGALFVPCLLKFLRPSVTFLRVGLPPTMSQIDEDLLMANILERIPLSQHLIVDHACANRFLSSKTIFSLASLSHLENLTLQSATDCHSCGDISSDSHHRTFSSLRSITLNKMSVALSCTLLNLIQSDQLDHMDIHFRGQVDVSSLVDLLQQLKSHSSWHTSLQCVRLTTAHSTASSPVIHHLFAFRNITSLRLQNISTQLDDVTLKEMAEAWPHLQSLVVRDHGRHSSIASLSGFLSLVTRCPDLAKLSFRLDATSIPPLPEALLRDQEHQTSRQTRKMTLVVVDPSQIIDSSGVAGFFLELFPKLKFSRRVNGRYLSDSHCSQWEQVEHIIKASQQ